MRRMHEDTAEDDTEDEKMQTDGARDTETSRDNADADMITAQTQFEESAETFIAEIYPQSQRQCSRVPIFCQNMPHSLGP